jgi:hypothetical protein
MAVSLTHFGEALIARMANELRGRFIELCKLGDDADAAFVNGAQTIAHCEVPLLPYRNVAFDGASRVDLVVRVATDRGIPFEVKLGATRLSKSRIDQEWLCGCEFSHRRKRFSGNVMSILERKFPQEVPLEDLRVKLNKDVSLKLTNTWFVIARHAVLKSWAAQARPAFSDRVRLLSFESIVDCYGGKDKFNALVREMLSFDYYDQWIKRGLDSAPIFARTSSRGRRSTEGS